jgi:phosphoribosyl 1,2-cyclic phosphate phosphodiesterase
MRVTFLGTGTSQGVPLIGCQCLVCKSTDPRDKRLRTSILVETEGKTFVVDTGPDFRQQMLREEVGALDAVILSHEHKDHLAGLDEIRAYNFLMKKVMPVYATPRVQEAIRREYQYIFQAPEYPGIPKIDLRTIGNAPFEAEGIPVVPIEVMHHQLPVLGFRFGNFTYITDANYISPAEKEKIRGTEVLVLNALRREPHISHFTLQQAIDLAKELKTGMTYFTHISHQMGLHADVEAELGASMRMAYDGLKVSL